MKKPAAVIGAFFVLALNLWGMPATVLCAEDPLYEYVRFAFKNEKSECMEEFFKGPHVFDGHELTKRFKTEGSLDPSNPMPHVFLGMTYDALELLFDAKSSYEKARELIQEPRSFCKQDLQSFLDQRLSVINAAIHKLEARFGRPESSEEREKLKLAQLAIRTGESSSNTDDFSHYVYAVHLVPDDPQVYRAYEALAGFWQYGGQPGFSNLFLKKSLALNPNRPQPELAELYGTLTFNYVTVHKYFPQLLTSEDWSFEEFKHYYDTAVELYKKIDARTAQFLQQRWMDEVGIAGDHR